MLNEFETIYVAANAILVNGIFVVTIADKAVCAALVDDDISISIAVVDAGSDIFTVVDVEIDDDADEFANDVIGRTVIRQ